MAQWGSDKKTNKTKTTLPAHIDYIRTVVCIYFVYFENSHSIVSALFEIFVYFACNYNLG